MQKVSLDVLEEICEHVKDATTLRSVALTCRGGRRAGQRHLFRALKFVKLNNPEVLGGAAWFGGALISDSKLVLTLAVIRHLSHWWFLSYVEK